MRTPVKKALACALTVAQILATLAVSQIATQSPAFAAPVSCASPGKDGSPATVTGTVDTYYQPPAGTVAPGATSLALGTIDTAGGGASTAVTANDLLLIVQMQDGSYSNANSSAYGSIGSVGSAGLYEYAAVASVAGGIATLKSGLLNSYTESPAGAGSGQKTYQIVRVPQYASTMLSSNFVGAYWDGKTGGIAALDVASTLNLGGASIYATGNGFRGGGRTVSGTSPATALNNDFVASAGMNGTNPPADGSKGEGVFGTPGNIFEYTNFSTPGTPAAPTVIASTTDGYPGGDMAQGAPGNAGGGGTDDDMAANDQNSGGGGGGNGGAGGNGGFPWTPNYPNYNTAGIHGAGTYAAGNAHDIGGRGGSSLQSYVSATRMFMGAGGGAGVNNNASNNNSFNAYGSSGGVGGGIVFMRIANTSGTAATIYANGTTGLAPSNDGGGGGGAGGTVVITSPNAFSGITVHADGAAGTTAYASAAGAANQHGPGGGGGGGVVLTTSAVTATVAGGVAGTTTTSATTYGAANGASGVVQTISPSQIPGAASGAECSSTGSGGTTTLYTGPIDTSDATYGGAGATGTYDGSVPVTNANDFTARSIPLPGASLSNSGTSAANPAGNTLALSSVPSISIAHMLYYDDTASAGAQTIAASAATPAAPAGWSVELCPDSSASGVTSTATSPNCAFVPSSTSCKNANGTHFTSSPAPGTAATLQICLAKGVVTKLVYWAVYTAPQNGLTAYQRYDGQISISDANGSSNTTHDELYAGFVPLFKSMQVTSTNCPAGAVVPAIGSCPGGLVKYTIDYRNVMAGAGYGTEPASAYVATGSGSLTITEDGALGQNNWATFSNGLNEVLQASANGTTTFGDSTGGSVFGSAGCTGAPNGNAKGAKCFTVQVGGAAFSLTAPGAGGTSQGTITFRVVVK